MIYLSKSNTLKLAEKNYFVASVFFHLIILFSLFFLPQSIRELILGKSDQKVIREFVQVDLVGMPRFTIKELKKMSPDVDLSKAPSIKPKNEISSNDESLENSNIEQSKQGNSLQNFLSTMSKKKLPKYKPVENSLNKKKSKGQGSVRRLGKLERLALEGNSLSRGAVSVGQNTGFSDDDYQIYISSIPSQVRPYWSLPSYLSDKNLRARVKIRLDGGGKLISLELVESSGVEEFDQRALQSVKSVKIFTTPSKSIRELLAIKGVILGFPL